MQLVHSIYLLSGYKSRSETAIILLLATTNNYYAHARTISAILSHENYNPGSTISLHANFHTKKKVHISYLINS